MYVYKFGIFYEILRCLVCENEIYNEKRYWCEVNSEE